MLNFKFLSFFLIFTPLVFSKVTFKLITPKGKPSVVVNNKSYELIVDEFPLFKLEVDVNAPVTYYYTIDYTQTDEPNLGVISESFDRKLESGTSTLNEFFDRQITVMTHPKLPRAYAKWSLANESKLYDDTHISTIIIEANPVEINNLHQNPLDENLRVRGATLTYASPHSVRSFNNVTIGISGQSTIYAAKLSYKISNLKNNKNKELYKRSGIKLRAEHMDASFLRDKIYTDILNSLGVPTPQCKFTRLFINGKAIGLFAISDNVSNKRYLRETLNNGVKFDVVNHPFKADYFPPNAYGDLGYYGEANNMYGIYYYKGDDKSNSNDGGEFTDDEGGVINNEMLRTHLIPFLKEISEYETTQTLKMDIDMFLKFMAMEYLAGAVDNYWSRPGNYYLYKNVNYNGGYWYFLDSDFHYSFGVGGDTDLSLNATIDTYASINTEVRPSRPLLDNLRKIKRNDDFLKEVFIRLLNTSFNVNAIFPRIDSLAKLLADDVLWDSALPRVSGHNQTEDFKFTIDDFYLQTQSLVGEGLVDNYPLKYWIKEKGERLARELGVEYPTTVDYSLGEVETLVQTSNSKTVLTTTYTSLLYVTLLFIITIMMV